MLYLRGKFLRKHSKDKKYNKVKDHYTGKYRDAAHNISNLKYGVPKEIPIVSDNGPNYDYHFIIKELAEEFEGQFTSFGEKIHNIFSSNRKISYKNW